MAGLDAGSSSVRLLFWEAEGGRLVRRILRPWPRGPRTPQEVLGMWSAVVAALDEGEAWLGRRGLPLLAGGTSVFWHSCYLAPDPWTPRTPLYRWSDVGPEFVRGAAWLRERLDPGALHRAVGAPLHPSFPAAKAAALYTLRREGPELSLFGFEDLVTQALWGQAVKSASMASGTGLWEADRARWYPPLMKVLGLSPRQLPPVAPEPTAPCPWAGEALRRWPRLGAAAWTLPHGDGALSNLGLGATGEVWGLTVGTSAALRRLEGRHAGPDLPPSLFRYLMDGRRQVVGGALSGGGNLLAYLARLVRRRLSALERELEDLPVDPRGVVVVPYFWGARSPGWPLEARGALWGLTAETSGAQVVRAGMDAIGAGLWRIGRDLAQATGSPRAVRAGGRAVAASPALAQVAADALGLPLEVAPGAEESSARGAARFARAQVGLPEWPPPAPARRYLPRGERTSAYQELAGILEQLTQGGSRA